MADLEVAQDAPVENAITPAVPETAVAVETDLRSTIRAAVEKQRAPDETKAPIEAAPERPRSTDGKFVKPDEKPVVEAAKVEPVAAKTDEAPVFRPPPGWSPVSKVAYDKLALGDTAGNVVLTKAEADAIRGDVVKRETEMNKGLSKLAEYRGLDEYNEIAKRNGRALPEVLKDYRNFENQLQTDFLGGIELVCSRFGVHPGSLAQAIQSRLGGVAQNNTAGQQQPQARQQAPVDPSAIVKQAIDAFKAEQAQTELTTSIQKFAADPKNRFFDNVKPLMASLLQSGHAETLEAAYDMACRADPSIAPLINQQAVTGTPGVNPNAANQARQAGKAVNGAPAAGFVPAGKALNPNANLRDTIRAAVEQQRNRA